MADRRASRGTAREFQKRGRVATGGSQDAADAATRARGRVVVIGPWQKRAEAPAATAYEVVRVGPMGTEAVVDSYPADQPAAMTDAMTDAQQRADGNSAVKFVVRKVTTETIWESEER